MHVLFTNAILVLQKDTLMFAWMHLFHLILSLFFFACARWYFWFYIPLQQHTIHVVVSGIFFPTILTENTKKVFLFPAILPSVKHV